MGNHNNSEEGRQQAETSAPRPGAGTAWHAGRRAFLAGGLAAITAAAAPQTRAAIARSFCGLFADRRGISASPFTPVEMPPPFTREQLETIRSQISDDCHRIVSGPGNLESTRQALLADIWRDSESLPDRLQVTPLAGNPPPNARIAALENTSHCRVFDIDTGHGFNSVVRYLRPSNSSSRQNRLMIVQQGHGDPGDNGTDGAALRFLSNGFDVLFCAMPMSAENRWPSHVKVSGGCGHAGMAALENSRFNPLELFFNHLPAGIRIAEELNESEFRDISICGISGGAWTVTIYAALDSRIRLSFSVAGTTPHILLPDGGVSMYENGAHQSIYAICPLHLIYLLGVQNSVAGPNQTANQPRGQIQFYNECENVLPVSAAHYSYPIKYVNPVSAAAQRLGGFFSTSIHPNQHDHFMGDPHIEKMLWATRGEYLKAFGHQIS